MKNISLITSILLLTLIGCNPTKEDAKIPENGQNRVVDDSLENFAISQLAEIHHNLELIRKTQGLIGSGSEEVADHHAQIIEDISLINSLLHANEKKIAALLANNKTLSTKNNALSKLINETLAQLRAQEQQVLQLKQDLALEEFKVTDLSIKMDEMQVENEKLKEENLVLIQSNSQYEQDINKVFITYGTEKELVEKGIVEKKKNSFTKKLSLTNNFNTNRSFFVEQDLRQLSEFPINGKNPKVVSLHPEDSYTISETGNNYSKLSITDKTSFWSSSKFLVIQVN